MKPRSAKNKGYRMECIVRDKIREKGFYCHRTDGSGSGVERGDLIGTFPLSIEVKNQKRYKIQDWIRQAKQQGENWGLVFRNPETPESNPELYILMDFNWFLDNCNE
jgi:hypothetical protein